MKKNLKIVTALFICISLLSINLNIYAASSASISASSTTIYVGESTTITASISATETWSLSLSASGGQLSGDTNSTDAAGSEVSKQVMSAKFSSQSAGTYTIKLSGSVAGSDLVKQTISKSLTITVKEKEAPPQPPVNNPDGGGTVTPPPTPNKSTDATLKGLTVSPSGLSPKFTSGTTSYTLTVASDVNKITVTATPNNNQARYKVLGNTNLQEGTNLVKVVVTAESGATKTYQIKVTKKVNEDGENPPIPNVGEDPTKEPTDVKEVEIGLESLVITGLELSPAFAPNVFEYRTELKEDLFSIDILAKTIKEDSILEIIGNENLRAGENLISILVKSADGTVTQKYQITVNKTAENSQNTNLSTDNTNFIKQNFQKIILGVVAAMALITIITFLIMHSRRDDSAFINAKEDFGPDEDVNNNDDIDSNDNYDIDSNNDYDINTNDTNDNDNDNKSSGKGKRFK